jgi:hypothetical protein
MVAVVPFAKVAIGIWISMFFASFVYVLARNYRSFWRFGTALHLDIWNWFLVEKCQINSVFWAF